MKRMIVRAFALSTLAFLAIGLLSLPPDVEPARAEIDPPPIEGTAPACVDFKLAILGPFVDDVLELGLLDDFGLYDVNEGVFQADLPDEGWVWVNPTDRFREVEGVVKRSHTATVDFPATHDSHDQNTIIDVDDEYNGLLSRMNSPNPEGATTLVDPLEIELEWEHGTDPDWTGRNEPEPFFPRWAWPTAGDRVWAEGHWVMDCGHATNIDGAPHFRSEIHPARAIAAMRQQVQTLPGSGTTYVPVTATDLYIHGRAGFIGDVLTFGQEVLTTGTGLSHDVNDHVTTPIAVDYDFEVCLPAQSSPGSVPAYWFENGPGDTIGIDPELTIEDAEEPCDDIAPKQLRVHVPLAGSGATPFDVYAKKIYVGWVHPADVLRNITVKLDQMDLHTDKEVEFSLGGDCECTFFYVNIDKAADEWFRLADWWEETCNIFVTNPFGDDICIDHNQLYDYDSDELLGNGFLDFSGPTWNFLVANGQPFHIRSNGYDQDCQDDLFLTVPIFAHLWNALEYATCYYLSALVTFETGRNDNFERLNVCFVESDESLCDPLSQKRTGYGLGFADLSANGEYEMEFTVSEQEVTEDPADLAVTKVCEHEGEVALAGEPFTCTITVTNAGPGLPSNVVLSDTLTTALAGTDYDIGTPTFEITLGDQTGEAQNCTLTPPNQFSCAIGSVPVGGSATVEVEVTPDKGGHFDNDAVVSADTTDPDSDNNSAEDSVDVFIPIRIDIRPGVSPNPIQLSSKGQIPVAILRTADFNPTTVNPASLCFGDAEAPAQRDCTLAKAATFSDVDRDRDLDMVLHFETQQVGIDLGDTNACLIGSTTDGVGIYGCDSVVTVP